IRIAILSMGLNELGPFKPEERIIEYMLKNSTDRQLVQLSLAEFADETSSESPAPGGGSVAAYIGALGAGLGAMVANLTALKKDWNLFGQWAEKASACKKELLSLVDADTKAFEQIIQARGLPKKTEAEIAIRTRALLAATILAIEVPYRVMQVAFQSMEIIEFMAREGNPNSKSDAGVGALCARSAVWGAWLNVCINAEGTESNNHISAILADGKKILSQAVEKEKEILDIVGLTGG
ncbi:MAG TPA: cyclodeaminase/cyclohydrolase family protein, partial [Puia sp.]